MWAMLSIEVYVRSESNHGKILLNQGSLATYISILIYLIKYGGKNCTAKVSSKI